jgi:soluble lytic murein transglycosylase
MSLFFVLGVFYAISASAAATDTAPGETAASETSPIEELREQFLVAEKAIKRGRLNQYRQLESKLKGYPLYPYLQAAELSKRLSRASEEEVQNFLQSYADAPFADKLRYSWLKTLSRQGKYETFVENFQPTENTKQLCRYANALMHTEQKQQGYDLVSEIWLNGRSLPKTCDNPIKRWKNAGYLDTDRLWDRIKLVMDRRNHRLATYIGKHLPKNDRQWLTMWKKVQRYPETIIKQKNKFIDKDIENPVVLFILSDGIKRLARKNPLKAADYWNEIKDEYFFDDIEKENIEHRLAQSLANVSTPMAFNAIQDLDINNASADVISPHVFSALQNKEWASALAWMEHLNETEKNSERWLYWRARTLESMRYIEASHEIYREISKNRSYYSFLAADRIGNNYAFTHRPLNSPAIKFIELERIPAVARAHELFQLKRNTKARVEWSYAIKHMNKDQLLIAAQLADKWGWQNRTIPTLAKAKYWDEVELRFPLEHREHVEDIAREGGISPAWAFAVIRQESAFVKDARSPSGALGLMQLMPGTARYVARSMRIKRPRQNDLLKSDLNIRLGINYLNKLQNKFSGNTVLATAAYNAGPSNVNRWLSDYDVANTDLWIETVPYAETRDYLKRVMTYAVIYEQRLGLKSTPMFEHMAPTAIDYTAAVF